MLALLNILANENLKLKRNKLFPVCTLLALLLPTLMIIVDITDKGSIISKITLSSYIIRLVIPIQVIVFPVLSGFILTFLFQKEYGEKTLINTLTAPTNRTKFIVGKYLIWTVWVFLITVGFLLISYVACYSLYGNQEFREAFKNITELIIKIGLLNWLSMSPLLIICILQRITFYPSLLFSCIISGISFTGLYFPERIRDIIPWSAVTSITLLNSQSILPYISIIITHLLGLFLGIYLFKKQDL